jgi:hypothetical protein
VPQEFNTAQKKKLVVRIVYYQLIAGHLYKMGAINILRIYVLEHERPRILLEAHEGITGGHYAGKAIVQKVLRADYGGRLLTETQRTTTRNVMYVRGLVN